MLLSERILRVVSQDLSSKKELKKAWWGCVVISMRRGGEFCNLSKILERPKNKNKDINKEI